ncbi:glyoxalase I, Glyoxalase/Bleomycin resistance protein/Dihydroxybiphenyl dioxygenase [Artemisia annua]|uniref:Lactoylglutathione lyase n=1 Tax=Artemisia annua TaxID=35608 RepID=A0A2U1MGE9_ARTAN|nr:glyoxalase I, Glyoxalase/Bleomycin resistance protein/Dihydroxybiphenyl dioxygenase [Artemisia annua]
MKITLVIDGETVNVISAYAPQVGRSDAEKRIFWDSLDELVRECPADQRLIIGGDLNGHIGATADGYSWVHGGFGYGVRNVKGCSILEFTTAHNLVVANSFFKKRDVHLITFQSGGHSTQIDYLLVRIDDLRACKDCRVFPGEACSSHHRLVALNALFQGRRHGRSSFCLFKSSNQTFSIMAEAASSVPSAELLEFPKKDNRRFLHAVYRVGDLQRSIKFYTEALGMKLLRHRDVPAEKYSNAFLGFGPEESNFAVELTYNYGVDKYDIGTGFGHFAIATADVYKLAEDIKTKGGTITREAGPVKGGTSVIAFAKDPDGYLFELIDRPGTPEPLCQVMLRVGDLDRSIKFYEKALGMKLCRTIDRPEHKVLI